MSKYKKLSHVVYKCDNHIVWVPKYRFRILKDAVKDLVEKDIQLLCEWKGCEVEELNVQEDHVHLMISIPPKVSVSELMGTLKGKLAIKIIQELPWVEEEALLGKSFLGEGIFREHDRVE